MVQLGRQVQGGEPGEIRLEEIQELSRLCHGSRLYFLACDLFIRQRVEPLQAIFNQWISGAKAQVEGEDIPFLKIISWCQDTHDKGRRDLLERESRSLCRFLAPFSHSTWQATMAAVTEELGYPSYLAYLKEKRGKALEHGVKRARDFLDSSSELYWSCINAWLRAIPQPIPLKDTSRFDAIYILGMRYLDYLFPQRLMGQAGVSYIMELLRPYIPDTSRLHLHIRGEPGSQAYCIPIRIPRQVHVITGPLTGWLDLESLLHELGHAIFFLNNDPKLSVDHRELYISSALCEAFAFIFQAIALDRCFLEKYLDIDKDEASLLGFLHRIKFLTLARRYAAKTLIEYENFGSGRFFRGQDFYAKTMSQYTGFRYGPETYLFDLMPDFYSIDYVEAFLGAWKLLDYLGQTVGQGWYNRGQGQETIKSWASKGNRELLSEFLSTTLGLELNGDGLISSIESDLGLLSRLHPGALTR